MIGSHVGNFPANAVSENGQLSQIVEKDDAKIASVYSRVEADQPPSSQSEREGLSPK